MTAADTARCTVKALRAEARRLSIRGRSRMTTEYLRAAVAAALAVEAQEAAASELAARAPFAPGQVVEVTVGFAQYMTAPIEAVEHNSVGWRVLLSLAGFGMRWFHTDYVRPAVT